MQDKFTVVVYKWQFLALIQAIYAIYAQHINAIDKTKCWNIPLKKKKLKKTKAG